MDFRRPDPTNVHRGDFLVVMNRGDPMRLCQVIATDAHYVTARYDGDVEVKRSYDTAVVLGQDGYLVGKGLEVKLDLPK